MKTFNSLQNFFLITEILKIKEIFDYRGRISHETFISLNVLIGILFYVLSTLFYDIVFLSFSEIALATFSAIIFLLCLSYVMIILWIKRLHDLNKSHWIAAFLIIYLFSLQISVPDYIKTHLYISSSIGFFALTEIISYFLYSIAFIYLCFKKGNPEKNRHGVSANYKKHSSFFLFICYSFIGLGMFFVYFIVIGNSLYTLKNLESIKTERIERHDIFTVKVLKKRMPSLFGDFNFVIGRRSAVK